MFSMSEVRRWLVYGVSYMIPFVAVGGVLISISFLLQNPLEVVKPSLTEAVDANNIAAIIFRLGATMFGFLIPVLAGFIAFAIADRPAIAPGFLAGALAGAIGAGYLGGILGGLLAGLISRWIEQRNVPPFLQPSMPIVINPLLTSIAVGFLLVYVLGKPLNSLSNSLNNWLQNFGTSASILLGIVLGLMMAIDMGGPFNRVAYTLAAGGIANLAAGSTGTNELKIMAAAMAAGMVPPLGMALATVLRKHLFTDIERENGKAAWVLGASFITEGAIPFAAADPLRVIPSIMAGSAVTGGLVMAFGNTVNATHGGIWVHSAIGGLFTYLIAILIGMALTAALVILLKNSDKNSSVDSGSDLFQSDF